MSSARARPVASLAPGFARISRRSLADDVRQQLERHIRSGVFAPGAMLPDELTLCREFGISRPSVREAIREVIAIGLVERRSNRAFVVERLPAIRIEADVRAARIREVFETRRLIEVEITALAATRATPEQREEIADFARLIEQTTDVEQLRPLDRAFHAVIGAASGNALLAELHAKVLDAVFATAEMTPMLGRATTRADGELILADSARVHTAIAAAVVRGDAAGAAAAAAAHLDHVERRLDTAQHPPAMDG